MSLLNTGRSELEQANYASKTSTDMANKRQAQKSSLEYQNDVANNNRNGALAGSAVNLGIAYAGYKHDQQVSEAKGLASREALGNSGGMNNPSTGNSIANSDAFRSGTGDQGIKGAGGDSGLSNSEMGPSLPSGVSGTNAGGGILNNRLGAGSPAAQQGLASSQGQIGAGSTGYVGGTGNSSGGTSGDLQGSNAGGTAFDNGTGGPGGGYNNSSAGSNTGSSGSVVETTQSLNTDVTNSASTGNSSGENSGGSSGGGAGGAAGAAFLVGGLYQLFSSWS